MERRDLHVHTTYSDGRNTPEEMVLAAIRAGLSAIGFTDHSHTAFDESWCMKKDAAAAYRREIGVLKEKYRGSITVLCGIEQDYYSNTPTEGYDYVIGSVHYVEKDGMYLPVDEDAASLLAASETRFGGDIYALIEEYYRTVGRVAEKTGADIIGHFDLITKFNEQTPLFDERHPRYLAAWQAAANALLPSGAIFEVNTGAMARGYRTVPYPSAEIRQYLLARGAKLLPTGDSHSADTLCFGFDRL